MPYRNSLRPLGRSVRMRTMALAAFGLCVGAASVQAADMTVDLNARGGPLKKAGLGSLFGASSIAGGTPSGLIGSSMLNFSASQGRIGENASNPFSTEAVAPVLRGTGGRMICRFNDLMYGWAPYNWPGYTQWINQVTSATRSISSNYKDVVYAIAPFNEPDTSMSQAQIMGDSQLQGATYDDRINYLWTQTVRAIRGIDSSIKIMGPNYQFYRPFDTTRNDAARMRNFLQNAIATGTTPDIIGWHSLGPSPGDVPAALSGYYRPLENQLGVPGRPLPVSIEEYGPGSGDFEGVPGTMVKHWAEFERYGVDFAAMGIYANGGLLGNTLRYAWDSSPQPNGGWYMMNWYRQMTGQYVPVSRWDARYYQAFDGVASWDSNGRNVTIILGGSDDDADVHINGVGALGIGTTVRVRVDSTVWDVDPNQRDQTVEHGGDPKSGTYNIFDKNLTLDGNGNITVPIHRVEGYTGYRILVSPSGGPDNYPTKYEAENATLTHVAVHNGGDAVPLASNNGYVGGIDFADSSLQFHVNVPAKGIYMMTARYANGTTTGNATHNVTVNGGGQGSITYPYTTAGWSSSEMRTATKRVALEQGANTITLSKGAGNVELDYIDVRPDTHRYEAEFATLNNVTAYSFANEINVPNFVGGINNTDSYVDFAIDAPRGGSYQLTAGYANGTGGNSTLNLTVNGGGQGWINLPATPGWLSAADPRASERTATATVNLNGGLNHVRLQKGSGYAELDYVSLAYGSGSTASPLLSGRTYHLVNAASGRTLDSPNGTHGTQLITWPINPGSNQFWTANSIGGGNWTFTNGSNGFAIDNAGWSTNLGTIVEQWDNLGNGAQQWQLVPYGDGSYKVVNTFSHYLMDEDLSHNSVIQWFENGGPNQHWFLQPVN